MNKAVNFSSSQKAYLWLGQFLLVVAALLYIQFSPSAEKLSLNADLLSIFETKQRANELSPIEQITERVSQQASHKQIVLVSANEVNKAIAKADEFAKSLRALPLIDSVQVRFSEIPSLEQIVEQYQPYQHQVITRAFKQRLLQGDKDDIFAYQFALLSQPSNQAVALTAAQDPSLSLADFLSQPSTTGGALQLEQEHLVAKYQGKYFVLISFVSSQASINIDAAQQLVAQFHKLIAQDSEAFLYTGAMFYTSKASQVGQSEMQLYGSISIVATLLLLALVYRSFIAMVMTSSLIVISFLYGYLALSICYQQVSVIALVFSITLIGIAADYSFHALTEMRYRQQNAKLEQDNPIANITSSLTMGYITTGAGYALLLLAPFILFKQIAIFTLFGLLGALLTVLLLYPLVTPLLDGANDKSKPLPKVAFAIHGMQQALVAFILRFKHVCIILFALLLACTAELVIDDDVRDYYRVDSALAKNEAEVKAALKQKWDLQYFLLRSDSEQSLLQLEEQLTDALVPLIEQGELGAYSAVSQFVPSLKRQQENQTLINSALEQGAFQQIRQLLAQANWQFTKEQAPLLPQSWLASPLGKVYQAQWFQKQDNYYAIVKLSGIKDIRALSLLSEKLSRLVPEIESDNKVYFIDKTGQISKQLNQFSQQLLLVIVAAIIAALAVFIWRYGLNRALIAILTPVFALLCAFSVSFLLQGHLNIFNLVAGVLILALGLDYSVFYAEHGLCKKITLTTLMSALSSIFVFAILMLSSMPAINSFGLTVFVGVLITFVFAPIVTLTASKVRPTKENTA